MRSRKLLYLLWLLPFLLLCACGETPAQARAGVSLWYAEDDPAAEVLLSLVEEYNQSAPAGQLAVSPRSLPDEESLFSAVQGTVRPDLLLCSRTVGGQLQELGLLQDASSLLNGPAPDYAAGPIVPDTADGHSLFPLGASVPLLCLAAEIPTPEDLDALCAQAADFGGRTGLPWFGADAFAPLFAQMLQQRGAVFHATREADLPEDAYREVYNLLAGAAFAHGLSLAEDPAALVQAGHLPCGVVGSACLPELPSDDCRLLPLPGLENGAAYAADLRCLAVTARQGRAGETLGAFLSWLLSPEQLDRLCFRSGLVPAYGGAVGDGDPRSELLCSLSQSRRFFLPDLDRDYRLNRGSFESAFRAAMARLS